MILPGRRTTSIVGADAGPANDAMDAAFLSLPTFTATNPAPAARAPGGSRRPRRDLRGPDRRRARRRRLSSSEGHAPHPGEVGKQHDRRLHGSWVAGRVGVTAGWEAADGVGRCSSRRGRPGGRPSGARRQPRARRGRSVRRAGFDWLRRRWCSRSSYRHPSGRPLQCGGSHGSVPLERRARVAAAMRGVVRRTGVGHTDREARRRASRGVAGDERSPVSPCPTATVSHPGRLPGPSPGRGSDRRVRQVQAHDPAAPGRPVAYSVIAPPADSQPSPDSPSIVPARRAAPRGATSVKSPFRPIVRPAARTTLVELPSMSSWRCTGSPSSSSDPFASTVSRRAAPSKGVAPAPSSAMPLIEALRSVSSIARVESFPAGSTSRTSRPTMRSTQSVVAAASCATRACERRRSAECAPSETAARIAVVRPRATGAPTRPNAVAAATATQAISANDNVRLAPPTPIRPRAD